MERQCMQVFFFDEGNVTLNDTEILFPYMKARLLFLMLLEARKPIARRILCKTIWSEEPERAKQNLRNALSTIRKILPMDSVSANREAVWIDNVSEIESDLDLLDAGKLNETNVEHLARPFLGQLHTSEEATFWITDRQNHYRKKLAAILREKISKSAAEQKAFWQIWLQTMEGPSGKQEKLSPTAHVMPFGRLEERDSILTFLRETSDANMRGAYRCAILYGEEGSGKSALANETLRYMETYGLTSFHGHPSEDGLHYRETLEDILEKLLEECPLQELKLPSLYESYLKTSFPNVSYHRLPTEQNTEADRNFLPKMDFNPHLLGRIFAFLFNRRGAFSSKPVFLLLEDIHLVAQWVPDFLYGLFLDIRVPFTTLLTSYPEIKPALDVIFAPLQNTIKRNETLLSRLTLRQTEQMCRQVLPAQHLTPEKLADIYEHTDGSPFLLSEFLRFYDMEDWSQKLSKSLNEIVHRRILSLTEEEKELLDCVAVFPSEAHFGLLQELSGFSEVELLKLYEKLHGKGLLYDRESGNSYIIAFRYSLIKKQIKEAIPKIKWWSLHRRLLSLCAHTDPAPLEEKDLIQIAHHAGDYMTELDARIRELKKHFEFNHELFPKLSDTELFETPRLLNDTLLTANYLGEAQKLLDNLVRSQGKTQELIRQEQTLLTIWGGYLRWNGDYAGAANYLKEALCIAVQQIEGDAPVVDVLEQFCYLGIQLDDRKTLEKYVFQFYRTSQKALMAPQVGMALRFIAILSTMKGNYNLAEKQLNMSLRLFEKLESQGKEYTLGVIAATHYHGDIALYKESYEGALMYYLQCAKLCEGKGFYRGIGVHLAKAAWCELRLGRIEDVREHLAFARPLFEGFSARRGASLCGGEIIFGLSALLNLWDGSEEKAYLNLQSANELVSVIQKPLWEGLLFCIKALLKESGNTTLTPLLPEHTGCYLTRAEKYLSTVGLSGELECFEQYRSTIGLQQ